MEGSVGAPPQRVCPNCARISWATGPRCPYCRARFRRQTATTMAWMLAVAVLVVLAGVLVMLLIAGERARSELDRRVERVQRDFDASVAQIREDVRRELQQATPLPSATPSPVPPATPTPSPGATKTPTPPGAGP
jgi:hypothetical protein